MTWLLCWTDWSTFDGQFREKGATVLLNAAHVVSITAGEAGGLSVLVTASGSRFFMPGHPEWVVMAILTAQSGHPGFVDTRR